MKKYEISDRFTGLRVKGALFGMFGSMVVPANSLPDEVRIFYYSSNASGYGINHAKKIARFSHDGKDYDYYESYGAGGLKNALALLSGKNEQSDCHILAD